jgi:Phosphotransferase enzyme family
MLMVEEELLAGGVANSGAVVRVGDDVLRPSNRHSRSIHRFLSAMLTVGFDGAPEPVRIDEDGRERLKFIAGDVAVPPFPAWVQTRDALESVSALIRRFHDASRRVDLSDSTWSEEMADPEGGPVLCHNDVCLENVVFRNGTAVGLLDFDFVAPGRAVWDLARFAAMCVPLDDDADAARLGWVSADRPARVRVVVDAYGLASQDRGELLSVLDGLVARSGEWVLSKVKAGDPNFIKMWDQFGGMGRHDRRRQWWASNRRRIETALR